MLGGSVEVKKKKKMRKFDLSLRSSRRCYFATFRHQLTIMSKTDALDEEKWLNMLGTFVKAWFRYESHFVHCRDSLVDILKERRLLSDSDVVHLLFSSRRRHTRLQGDWSSDVCSSDLTPNSTMSKDARRFLSFEGTLEVSFLCVQASKVGLDA